MNIRTSVKAGGLEDFGIKALKTKHNRGKVKRNRDVIKAKKG